MMPDSPVFNATVPRMHQIEIKIKHRIELFDAATAACAAIGLSAVSLRL
jgi:hypothetical protein